MEAKEWVTSSEAIEKSNRPYAHFDYRTNLSACAAYITNPQEIAKHGFYPFIHYEKKMIKFSKENGKKVKIRDICYASHIDRCIFQYYNHILNELYNQRLNDNDLHDVPIAYRTDLHKSNGNFAKMAFDFIRANSPCYIMIGDFTKFFDNLDHKYLKEQWCSLIGQPELPQDQYAVFKNVTRYSTWELDDLLELNGLANTRADWRKLNKQSLVLSPEKYNAFRTHICKNKKPYGIPQGSPISGLLANIYMLEIDQYINEVVSSQDGIYMRYSDDFIIVLPSTDEGKAIKTLIGLTQYINGKPGITLEPEKTQYFLYNDGNIENCSQRFQNNSNGKNQFINFLGFTFDGQKVSIRSKTISKYYYKMYRKAQTISKNGGYTSKGTKISGKNLYIKYSFHGANNKRGNFLTYVMRTSKIFGENELIERDTRRHMQKIRKAINLKENDREDKVDQER